MNDISSERELEELKQRHDVLVVYFTASACNVGEALLPKVDALLNESGVAGALVNTTDVPAAGGQHLVLTVPTVLVFVYGREFDRLARHISLAQVEGAVQRAMEMVAPD